MRSSTRKAAPTDIGELNVQIQTARADLDAAQSHLRKVVAEENANLASDETYLGWTRTKRLAENQLQQAVDLVANLEAQLFAAHKAAARSAFEVRYAAAAAQNQKVTELYRTVLPQAWEMIADVMRQAALARIETEAVQKAMPSDFAPTGWIGDPDRAVRCRPSVQPHIISEETVELWVDSETGNRFANQSAPPKTRTAIKRRFRQTVFQPMRPAGDAVPFFRGLVFPRVGNAGGHLFDGSKLQSPRDVLAALAKPVVLNEPAPRPLVKTEPI